MLKNNLGYPRVGAQRELKKACESYWANKITSNELLAVARLVEEDGWRTQLDASIDLIPINDFSLYDQVLDMVLLFGAIPERFLPLIKKGRNEGLKENLGENESASSRRSDSSVDDHEYSDMDLCFAMARGYQKENLDIVPMEMTKWFDTNYHYIVPEFNAKQKFELFSNKIFSTFKRAKVVFGKRTPKPVLIGPLSFLFLGKEKGEGFNRLDLLTNILPVYIEILTRLKELGAEWIQLDEPYLALDLSEGAKQHFQQAYREINRHIPELKVLIGTYFDGIHENASFALDLPIAALHLDLIRAPQQLDPILRLLQSKGTASRLILSLGVIDGRNIWRNDYSESNKLLQEAIKVIGKDRLMIAPSCSLLHVPFDLAFETNISSEVKNWLAFAKQKLNEISDLYDISNGNMTVLEDNAKIIASRRQSRIIHNSAVKQRTAAIAPEDARRRSDFKTRQKLQHEHFHLPYFPTTTIGSFPQTAHVRQVRAQFRKGEMTQQQYEEAIQQQIVGVIKWQEEIGLDVLVHGEFERNDMVEYFGELLQGFLFTSNGWVTSYGSRCVKPPIIVGDVERRSDMTVRWSRFAQSKTKKLLKGMLTGPVTILQWSFVRDDQLRSETALQIALAIRDEVLALERAGLRIIQIDEPAIREGLPLRVRDWNQYLQWAIQAFKIASCGVRDETQIHTHMCYSEFNDIIQEIASMDADVITIENSRSQFELLRAFSSFKYPNEIGPGVYDIHSPRVPLTDEIFALLKKASAHLPPENIWVNPDCGLKTRKWEETKASLSNMVEAARRARELLIHTQPSTT